jgi:hypothetical protein
MTDHKALQDLKLIMLESREGLRMYLLNEWISKWIYKASHTQHVINKSILNTSEIDFTWYNLATMCAKDLIDDQISNNSTTNTSFTCEVLAIRSPNGKLKKDEKNIKKIR